MLSEILGERSISAIGGGSSGIMLNPTMRRKTLPRRRLRPSEIREPCKCVFSPANGSKSQEIPSDITISTVLYQ